MILVNGYTATNRPFPTDRWIPVKDTYNDWMELGDDRLGVMHCARYGCPSWGIAAYINKSSYEYYGYVCLRGYWNPDRTTCISCMNICFSCADATSCNQ